MYDYTNKYEFTCPQCKKDVTTSSYPNQCKKCSIELCDTCYEKKYHICAWCLDEVDDDVLWKKKIAKYLILLVPIIVLLLPAPMPIFILLITSFTPSLLLITLLMMGITVGFVFLFWFRYHKKIVS